MLEIEIEIIPENTLDEIIVLLEKAGFKQSEEYVVNDTYFFPNSITQNLSFKDMLNKSIILRKFDINYTEFGEILSHDILQDMPKEYITKDKVKFLIGKSRLELVHKEKYYFDNLLIYGNKNTLSLLNQIENLEEAYNMLKHINYLPKINIISNCTTYSRINVQNENNNIIIDDINHIDNIYLKKVNDILFLEFEKKILHERDINSYKTIKMNLLKKLKKIGIKFDTTNLNVSKAEIFYNKIWSNNL